MPKPQRFTITKNKKTGTWDLKEQKSNQIIHSFKSNETARKYGAIKKLVRKSGRVSRV